MFVQKHACGRMSLRSTSRPRHAVVAQGARRKKQFLHGWQRENVEDPPEYVSRKLASKGGAKPQVPAEEPIPPPQVSQAGQENQVAWWDMEEEPASAPASAPAPTPAPTTSTDSLELDPWQEERLVEEFARGRRKMKILDLSIELGIARSELLDWVKEFSQKQAAEQTAAFERVRPAIEAAQAAGKKFQAKQASEVIDTDSQAAASRSQAKQVSEAGETDSWVGGATQSAASSTKEVPKDDDAESQAGGATKSVSPTVKEVVKGEGFIPYYTRKEMGQDPGAKGKKRLSADTMRTLESIYQRTDFPSKDIIKGLWDLHKLPREIALDWFTQRRDKDGVTSSTQKRRHKEKDFLDYGEDNADLSVTGDKMLISFMGDVVPVPAAAAAAGAPAEAKTSVPMTSADMAALRSSMPSPRKFKGKKIAEEMGITSTPASDSAASSTTIGNVEYVEQPKEIGTAPSWSNIWRYRNSEPGVGKPLILKNREKKVKEEKKASE
eukprot:gene16180-22340_t